MSSFAFYPDLFQVRTDAMEALAAAGLEWMSDFASVDVLHDLYGLEVCGVQTEDHAKQVLGLLQGRFAWRHGHVILKGWGRDAGWKAVVHRDPRERDQGWEYAG
jgi:hypothetical protein